MIVLPLNYYPMNGSMSSLPNDTVLCEPYSISKEVRFLLMGVNHSNFRSKITCQSSGVEPLLLFICGSSHIQLLLPRLWTTSPMSARVITRLVLKGLREHTHNMLKVTCGFEPLQPYQSPCRKEYFYSLPEVVYD